MIKPVGRVYHPSEPYIAWLGMMVRGKPSTFTDEEISIGFSAFRWALINAEVKKQFPDAKFRDRE